MSNMVKIGDKMYFHPGYYIKDIIEDEGITISDFAEKAKIPNEILIKLINGEMDVTNETVNKLATTLGTSSVLWLNLQDKFNQSK